MPCCHDNQNTIIELAMQRTAAFSWAGQKAMRSPLSHSLRSPDALHLTSIFIYLFIYCERSELPSLFNARIFYIFIYIYIYLYIYIYIYFRRSMTEQEAVVKAVEERQSSSSPSSSSATLMCPSIGGMPINESTTDSYFTCKFPTLFPTGAADFSCQGRQNQVTIFNKHITTMHI